MRVSTSFAFALALILIVVACGGEAPQQADTTVAMQPVVTRTSVNEGTYGMMSQVRWAFSPDRRSVLVVVDPVSVEAEPVPDGFFFGSEEPAFQVQVDTVWDVAPSPDWRALAFSRAYVLAEGEADSVPQQRWDELARKTGIDAATLRTSSFAASGMAYARGIAQPALVRVPSDPRAASAADASRQLAFGVPRGWRVRWTADGRTIALGANPQSTQDDAPSNGWAALDPNTGQIHGSLASGTRLVEPRWINGPDLILGDTLEISSAPTIAVKRGGLNYLIESQRGVITVRDPAFQTRAAIAVGPGKALAATASGRYIIALAPRAKSVPNEHRPEIVVYTVAF